MMANVLHIIGQNYKNKKIYDEMKKYYIFACALKNHHSMYELGSHYQFLEKNYNKMKEYYKLAIKFGNTNAMHNMGYHYQYTNEKYNKMKKYYKLAIQHNCSRSMTLMGNYYYTKQNYQKVKKYYKMGIDNSHIMSYYWFEHYVTFYNVFDYESLNILLFGANKMYKFAKEYNIIMLMSMKYIQLDFSKNYNSMMKLLMSYSINKEYCKIYRTLLDTEIIFENIPIILMVLFVLNKYDLIKNIKLLIISFLI